MAASSTHPTRPVDFDAAVEAAKLQALYNLAYGLSHEINNPLANITLRAQALIEGERNPVRRKSLAAIVQQAYRAHEMIADLMFFARPPALQREEVDLTKLAKTIVAEMREQAREQGTKLTLTKTQQPLLATADPTQLAVALKALVQNALEAVRTAGAVEVGVQQGSGFRVQVSEEAAVLGTRYLVPSTPYPAPSTPSAAHDATRSSSAVPPPHFPDTPHSALRAPHFRLSVTDTGPGIPPEIRPHIFDPYFSGREAGRGLGLGLSKAWRIAELHGGTIEVESPDIGGARLTIALP